jgi:cell division transport system ATP-binding protein
LGKTAYYDFYYLIYFHKKIGVNAVIEFRDVTKIYGSNDTHALENVNIKIEDGEFVFIVGSSGAGKSTFLKLIMHEEKPTSGEVIVNGYASTKMKKRQVPYYRRTMGIVFQDFRIIPKMSVYDNVAFAMRVIGTKEKDIRKRVPYILQLVGLSQKARSMPNELSGGEQQRVSLARALVNNPDLIIADEPTGNVDPEMSHEIVELLTKINNNGTTVVMVTHEHDLVRTFQRRVIVIQKGKVVSDTPDPTFAKFKTKETKKENDMFYYEQDVKNENLTEVFEDLEDLTDGETQSESEVIGSIAQEEPENSVDLNELAKGGEQ